MARKARKIQKRSSNQLIKNLAYHFNLIDCKTSNADTIKMHTKLALKILKAITIRIQYQNEIAEARINTQKQEMTITNIDAIKL